MLTDRQCIYELHLSHSLFNTHTDTQKRRHTATHGDTRTFGSELEKARDWEKERDLGLVEALRLFCTQPLTIKQSLCQDDGFLLRSCYLLHLLHHTYMPHVHRRKTVCVRDIHTHAT